MKNKILTALFLVAASLNVSATELSMQEANRVVNNLELEKIIKNDLEEMQIETISELKERISADIKRISYEVSLENMEIMSISLSDETLSTLKVE